MGKFTKFARLIVVSTSILSTPVFADSVAIGPKIGSLGYGAEARVGVMENTFARLGFNYFSYSHDYNDGEINYKGKLTLATAPLMLDFHPFNSGFRVSAGVAYNGNKITIKATPEKSAIINGRTYTPQEIGSISGTVKMGSGAAGLLTLGYDNSLNGSSNNFSFDFEAGIMYTGTPKATVSSSGLASTQPQFIADLEADANKNFKKQTVLKLYPVLSIGMKYSF